jgi:hypothetical protein
MTRFRPLGIATAATLAAGLGVAATGAGAAKKPSPLWATVNVCDTERHPDMAGFRAQAPGNNTDQRIYMRFRAQWFRHSDKTWHTVGGPGTSPWVYAGSARFKTRQAGWTFGFNAPPQGQKFTIRGVVYVHWRERGGDGKYHPVKRARLITFKGHPGTKDSDPPGYSNGVCVIR